MAKKAMKVKQQRNRNSHLENILVAKFVAAHMLI